MRSEALSVTDMTELLILTCVSITVIDHEEIWTFGSHIHLSCFFCIHRTVVFVECMSEARSPQALFVVYDIRIVALCYLFNYLFCVCRDK